MKRRSIERFLEFLIIGILLGVTEDLIAVKIATGATIDLEVIGIIILVAIPFAAFSELVVDRDDFLHIKKMASWIHDRVRGRRSQ